MKKNAISISEIPVSFIIRFGLLGLLCLITYYSALSYLWDLWKGEDLSYCYLVPLVTLYLIWDKKQALVAAGPNPTWKGLPLVIVAFLFFFLGELSGEYYSLHFSFWILIIGYCWLLMGWQRLKILIFPLGILLTAIPFPFFVYANLTLRLKLISSQLGVLILQWYGMSAYREGNIIDLGFTQLQVVDACSGLRFLFPLFVLGLLLAYFFKAHFWKRFILVISTIPITIITNSLRIALTGIFYEIWGSKVAEGFFHGFSGWFIFMFALSIMLLEMWALSGFKSFRASKNKLATDTHRHTQTLVKSSKAEPPEARTIGAGQPQVVEGSTSQTTEGSGLKASNLKPPTSNWLRAFLSPPQFVVAVILLGLTLVLSQGIEFREKIPIAKSFNQFPDKVGEWTGKSQTMEKIILDELDFSDYIMVNFSNKSGKWVNFYTAYYESQRKGGSIHSPASCLPGGGWIFKEGKSTHIPMPGYKDGFIPVNRAFMIKSGYKQLSYYWFPQRDRILTNAYQLKLYNFWDALTRQRTDGALVRVITPVYDNEELADAEKRLQSFTQDIVPVLDEFLPK